MSKLNEGILKYHELDRFDMPQESKDYLVRRFYKGKENRDKKFVDYKLLSAFKDIMDYHNYEKVDRAVNDDRVTKMFYNVNNTVNAVKEYGVRHVPSFQWNKNYKQALHLLEKQLFEDQIILQPIDITTPDDLYKVWSNKDAKVGCLGKGTKEENKQLIFDVVQQLKPKIEKGALPQLPVLIFHRAHCSNFFTEPKKKDRPVFGVDGATSAIEGMFARPLIDYIGKRWFGYAGGKDPVTLRTNIGSFSKLAYWLSNDYSKFDTSVQNWMINDCFGILKKHFDSRFECYFKWMLHNFKNNYVILPDGTMFHKLGGIPSGSFFTQLVGSMANFLMIVTFILSRDGDLRNVSDAYGNIGIFVMGDDSLVFSTEFINPKEFEAYVSRNFGVNANADKAQHGTTLNSKPSFLKREWWYERGEYRDLDDLIVNSIHPEGPRTYDGYTPYMIIYGLKYLYNVTFNGINESLLLLKINKGNLLDVDTLVARSFEILPGSFRALSGEEKRKLFLRANHSLKHYKTVMGIM